MGKRAFWGLLIMAAGWVSVPAAEGQAPEPRDAQPGFIVLYRLGPGYEPGQPVVRQPGFAEHARYQTRLGNGGQVAVGGPFGEAPDRGEVDGAMLLVRATSIDEARRIADEDPGVVHGFMEVAGVHRFLPAVGGWPGAEEIEEARQEIAELDRRWTEAVRRGDAETVAELFAPEGQILVPDGPPIVGREAVRQFAAGVSALPELEFVTEPQSIEVSAAVDMAVLQGVYHRAYRVDGDRKQTDGTYLVVWFKDRDGSWRVRFDSFTSS